MAEVIVSTPELTVLGGPASVEVDTNVGAAGNRGVFVFFGLLNPNNPAATFGAGSDTPIVFDLYILVDSSSDDYLAVFQYVVQDGIPQWIEQIKLTPNFYGTNRVVTFVDGVAELEVNIFEIGLVDLRSGNLPLEDSRFRFSVQATLSNYEVNSESDALISSEHLPAAVSVKVQDIFLDETDSQLKLPITLYGAEFDGTSMQNIDDKNVVAHLSILVVNPSEVTDFFEESES
jgi:hypothetical protein